MSAFSRAIDRFCQTHRNFGIPRLMLYIVLISAGIFIIDSSGMFDISFIELKAGEVLQGQVWRLVTWIFIPVGGRNIFFAAISLYFYYFIGSSLESEWGAGKFTIFYFFGVLLHIVYIFILWFATGTTESITPFYLNLSMLFAFATLFPDYTIRLFLIIPIKIKWLAILSAAFFLLGVISGIILGQLVMALLPLVPILNYILICGDELFSYIRPLKFQSSPQVVDFKKAAKQVKRDLKDKPYRHKCEVCGKTDVDHPDLEFRYCSRCNGYHCFCIEHINNHIHFE